MENKCNLLSIISLLLTFLMLVCSVGCDSKVSAASVDLMNGIAAEKVKGNSIDDKFIIAETELAFDMFKDSFSESNGNNMLVSPISVSLALSMTANGADGDTRKEMESYLGRGISLDNLNKYYKTYLNTLPNSDKASLSIANSIWFKDSKQFSVKESFLQTNANWYGASIYKSPFDTSTVSDINVWVKSHTNGRIDKMVESIDQNTIMYLINAVAFQGEWAQKYTDKSVSKGTFTTADREFQTAEFMLSNESYYLDDGSATGFVKHYSGNRYAFVALLPNAGTTVSDYIGSLTAEKFAKAYEEKDATVEVRAYIPKFSYSYELTLNNQLKAAGIPTAFDKDNANFKNLGQADGNIYIADVLHKTAITLDEAGTVASASTKVDMAVKMSATVETPKVVKLDRPFVYMIIDTVRGMPLFLGSVMSVE